MTSAQLSGRPWLSLAAPLPALALGVLLMRHSAVPTAIWGQNLFAGVILTTVCAGMLWFGTPAPRPIWWGIAGGLSFVLLLATFADAGIAGVHRWVKVGGAFRLHAAAIGLPVLIIVFSKTLVCSDSKLLKWPILLLALGILALLALQPDAAQATAFAGALLVLLAFCGRPPYLILTTAFIILACVAWVWTRPDPLSPVRHVEGIVGVAAERGILWRLASLVSLGLLPWPFLLAREEDRVSREGLALGVYFLLTLLAPWFGAFPVPLLGYGLSPIVGYFVALAWVMQRYPCATREQLVMRAPPPEEA